MSDDEAAATSPESDLVSYQRAPEKSPDDYYEYIDLDGKPRVFDFAGVKKEGEGLWVGRDERRDEVLCLIPDQRFVLMFAFDRYEDYGGTEDSIKTPPDWIDRELSQEDAALWFRLNRHDPPKWLEPVPIRDPSQDPASRLNREWRLQASDLPGSESQPEATYEPPVVLAGPDDEVIVWGKRKPPLPPAQYRVIKALVEAKEERLSKDMLCNRTKDKNGNTVEDPVGALKRLRKRDPDWRKVIDMAGMPGRGYSLRDRPPTSTQKSPEIHPRRPRGG